MSDGIHWGITLKVECPMCGAKVFNLASGHTEFTPPFNSNPWEDSLDDLRTDFVMNLEMQGWEVSHLDYYDALGVFTCPPCVRKEERCAEEVAVNA